MKSEQEIREKIEFLQGQFDNSNDLNADREIDRLKWVLGEGPDHIHVPKIR